MNELIPWTNLDSPLDEYCKQILKNNLIEKMAKEHNLNKTIIKYFEEQFDNIIEKETNRKWFATNRLEQTVTKNEMGIPFGLIFSDNYINVIKQIFTYYDYNQSDIISWIKINEIKDFYKINYIELCQKYQNINPEYIGLLSSFIPNDIRTYYEYYLDLLNQCDEKTQIMILNIIKPLSLEITGHAKKINYNKDSNSNYNYKGQIKIGHFSLHDIYLESWYGIHNPSKTWINSYKSNKLDIEKLNIYAIRVFEFEFTKQYELIKLILEQVNYIELLEELINIKEIIFNEMPNVKYKQNFVPGYSIESYYNTFTRCWEEEEYRDKNYDKYVDEADFGDCYLLIGTIENKITYLKSKLIESKSKKKVLKNDN